MIIIKFIIFQLKFLLSHNLWYYYYSVKFSFFLYYKVSIDKFKKYILFNNPLLQY